MAIMQTLLLQLKIMLKVSRNLSLTSWEKMRYYLGLMNLPIKKVKIDDKIREIVTEIKLEEARTAHRVNQIEESKAEVSIAT